MLTAWKALFLLEEKLLFPMERSTDGAAEPFFSIVIPTHNRPKQLATCLESLSHLDYPRDRFEVIVVDDGSPVVLETIVDRFRDRLNVILLTQNCIGPSGARNTGVKTAKGDFLSFIDDDCAPAKDWLRNLSDLFLRAPDRAIGGRTINGLPNNLYSVTSQTIVDVAYAYYNPDPNQASFFASNNLSMAADLFHAIGGFDLKFTTSEDRDFCDRWRHHDFKMTYAPEVVLYHSHNLKFEPSGISISTMAEVLTDFTEQGLSVEQDVSGRI